MRPQHVLIAIAALAASGVCVRLALWQLERRAEKHAVHSGQQALLAAPPLAMADSLLATPPLGVRVEARGRWERGAHVLLSGRTHLGAAGVTLVTPLVLTNGDRVLVERGWLASPDSREAHPEALAPEPAHVIGVVQPYGQPPFAAPWVRLPSDSSGVTLWSARALVADSARARLGAPLAAWVLRLLPVSPADVRTPEGGQRAPSSARSGQADDRMARPPAPEPEPFVVGDESMHLSYAIQWFAFAAIILGGSVALIRRR